MASEVSICNLGLGHLGDNANITAISPPDGSVQAARCAQFYPQARDALLEMHPWGFATRRTVPAAISLTPPVGWAFAYAIPANCLGVRQVLMPNGTPDLFAAQPDILTPTDVNSLNAQDYVIENYDDGTLDGARVMYTNVDTPTVVYTLGVTDTAKFSALFVAALARLLASYLAGPTLKGKEGREETKAQLMMFEKVSFPRAAEEDSNSRQSNPYSTSVPASISVRA